MDVVHPGYRYGVPQDSPRESSFTRRVAARSGGYGGHAGVRCNRTRHRGYNVVVTTLTCMVHALVVCVTSLRSVTLTRIWYPVLRLPPSRRLAVDLITQLFVASVL